MVQVNLFAGQEQRHGCREQTCGHQRGTNGEMRIDRYTVLCVRQRASGKPLHSTGASERRSEGLGCGGRKEIQEGGDKEYTSLIHCVVQQKLTTL